MKSPVLCFFNRVKYIALMEAPMVTMGILHNINRMFTIIISPSVPKNLENQPSLLKMFIKFLLM